MLLSHAHVHLVTTAHAMTIAVGPVIHHAAIGIEILDEAEPQRTPAVLVSGELGDGRFSIVRGVELDDAGAAGTTVGLVLDLGAVNFANRLEELDEVVVTG